MTHRMIIFLTIAISIVTLGAGELEALVITDCSKGTQASGALGKVSIANCNVEKDPYCTFVRETNATIEVDFKTTRPFSTAIVDVYGKIGLVPIPFPMRPNNACGNYGVQCPSKVDDNQKVTITMPIMKVYPTIALKCQLKLHDESNKPIICLEFPIKISK